MSEKIVKALMQLFAIIGDNEKEGAHGRSTVEFFLKQQFNKELVEQYLKVYDGFINSTEVNHDKEKKRKRTAVSSVKVIVICRQINEELTQKQKVLVMLRLIEFVLADGEIGEQEQEFINSVADSFNIPEEEYKACYSFVTEKNCYAIPAANDLLIINNKPAEKGPYKHLFSETLPGELGVLRVKSVGIYLARYFGSHDIYLNGQFISDKRIHLLTPGSSLRSSRLLPIYYSDIVSCFLNEGTAQRISFQVQKVEYVFNSGRKGLHELTFSENSGKMIGIMGGSGAGKSTLLNVLNGNDVPSSGKVLINGIDLHKQKHELEGVIGYVPQDDLLIDDLTVFENLFYNTKLCFADYSEERITEMVNKLLLDLGLEETKDLKVGNPLQKTISGGQRKRVNIALELIRQPAVLFVDEPTSGLSSRDSENIMDLLKELSLKGKLVFVVIHQPSSDIYKMFDKLLILDLGGYPIYYDNPVEALTYFKSAVNYINASETSCETCGNVNPEQVFNIIESKVLDENGSPTHLRKISPKEWNELFVNKYSVPDFAVEKQTRIISEFRKPGFFSQVKVFLTRDVLSKLSNKQYLAINLLEAPVLAFILAFLTKYYKNGGDYVFSDNKNLPAYIFMCVVVSLFIGLTVSAEEIIKDRKILKREAFLNLSRGSYLMSKISLLFFVSAVQTICFVLVGNLILGIKGMYIDYWIILFSTSCFANMLGLNISSSFNSAVTIYILIPFLLIPQLLLSGVIVKFDELHPSLSGKSVVPLTGDLMVSRWAFEALAVNQFKNNEYEKNVYDLEKQISEASFKKNHWYNKIIELSEESFDLASSGKDAEKLSANLNVIRHELEAEKKLVDPSVAIQALSSATFNKQSQREVESFIEKVKKHYSKIYNDAVKKRDLWLSQFQKSEQGRLAYKQMISDNHNLKIEQLVKNVDPMAEFTFIENERIHQNADPVFRNADPRENIRAHMFAPTKHIFGKPVSTFSLNILVIWFMSFVLFVTLYFDALRKTLKYIGKAGNLLKK